MYVNRVTISGRLCDHPKLTKDPADSTKDRVWARIANQAPGSKTVNFINLICWGAVARAVADHCKKGKMICLDGELKTRSTEREDGTYDNYSEVNCSRVSFGPDAKNSPAPEAAAQTPSPQAAMDQTAQLLRALQALTQGGQAQQGGGDDGSPFSL